MLNNTTSAALDWIEPGWLAVGPIPMGKEGILDLHSAGIRAIVSLTERSLIAPPAVTLRLFGDLDIAYLHMPVADAYPPSEHQAKTVARFIMQMHDQNRPVYLHCFAGIGRTGTLLHVYYLERGLSLHETKDLIRSRRPPNSFVMLTLAQQDFLNSYMPGDLES